MSDHNYNLNNSYDYFQSLNEQNNEKRRYDINTMTIPKRTKSPIVYDAGIDNYFVNEIKKAKYQGVFDPGSLGNKNIFLDSNKSNNTYFKYFIYYYLYMLNNQQKFWN